MSPLPNLAGPAPAQPLGGDGLIDLIATIPFHCSGAVSASHDSATVTDRRYIAKDILGHVYEYFLGQFALAEGKKGGQYFTPKSIVSLIVEMIEPYQGRVYDPAMGSGGFFVQSKRFIENRAERDRLVDRPARRVNAGVCINHDGTIGGIMVFGQESNPTTYRQDSTDISILLNNFGEWPDIHGIRR